MLMLEAVRENRSNKTKEKNIEKKINKISLTTAYNLSKVIRVSVKTDISAPRT